MLTFVSQSREVNGHRPAKGGYSLADDDTSHEFILCYVGFNLHSFFISSRLRGVDGRREDGKTEKKRRGMRW